MILWLDNFFNEEHSGGQYAIVLKQLQIAEEREGLQKSRKVAGKNATEALLKIGSKHCRVSDIYLSIPRIGEHL